MAVPKRKTTRSRAGKRRSHIKFSSKNVIEDKKSGEYKNTILLVFQKYKYLRVKPGYV